MFLLFLVVCGVIALVIVKVVKPNQKAIQQAAASITPDSVSNFTQSAINTGQDVINAVKGPRHRRALLRQFLQAEDMQVKPDKYVHPGSKLQRSHFSFKQRHPNRQHIQSR